MESVTEADYFFPSMAKNILAPDIRDDAYLVVKNDTYRIFDFPMPAGPTYSITQLFGHKDTRGHSHADSDETYIFLMGRGKMHVGKYIYHVRKGSVVYVPEGKFHKVENTRKAVLEFLTISPKGVKRPPM